MKLVAILMLVVACITLIIMINDSGQTQRFYRTVVDYINLNKAPGESKPAITRERPEIKKQDKKIQIGSRSTTRGRVDTVLPPEI